MVSRRSVFLVRLGILIGDVDHGMIYATGLGERAIVSMSRLAVIGSFNEVLVL